eukprot:s725_g7.t1
MSEVDVAIVGAGVAGLAAAVTLAEEGLKVLVLESRSILGGRARSWVDGVTRDPVHIGPHVVVSEYPNFFKLLEKLQTLDKPLVGYTGHAWVMTQPLPAPASWGPASIMDPFVTWADKHSTVPAAVHCLSLDESELMQLDGQSGADFLRGLGVSEDYINHFWGFLSHAILNVPVEEVSAAALVRFFRRLVGRSSMEMGFSGCGLGELLTPAKQLLEKLGSSVRTNVEVKGFLGSDRCEGAVLDSGEEIRPKLGVISSLPPQTLLPLVPPAWESAGFRSLEALKPCQYISVYIWFDRKVTEGKQMWARTYNKNDLNCEFYDFSEIYPGKESLPGHSLHGSGISLDRQSPLWDSRGQPWKDRPSFVGSNIIDSGRLAALTDEEIVQGTLREMQEQLLASPWPGTCQERFPRAMEAKVHHSVVNRIPMAIHRPVVGTESLRPDQATKVPGLYLSGCWTRTEFPSSMESAARSGFLAADALLRGSGRQSQAAVPYGPISLSARLVGKLDILRPLLLAPLFRGLVSLSGGATPKSKL